jgi:hypothetical protein
MKAERCSECGRLAKLEYGMCLLCANGLSSEIQALMNLDKPKRAPLVSLPVGHIYGPLMEGEQNPPTGWLWMNGQEEDAEEYPELVRILAPSVPYRHRKFRLPNLPAYWIKAKP